MRETDAVNANPKKSMYIVVSQSKNINHLVDKKADTKSQNIQDHKIRCVKYLKFKLLKIINVLF